MSTTHAIIMAGGAGTRFWPKSRTTMPKQLLALRGERTLLGETVERLAGLVPPERVWVITGEDQLLATREALPELPPERVVAEPARRDTAACIGLAATLVGLEDPEAAMIVLPADHVIEPPEQFQAVLARAVEVAREGPLVTIGIKPTHPATGYGYIQRGAADAREGVFAVERFVEKPDRERAEQFLASGDYYWNGGIFAFTVASILGEFARCLPDHTARLKTIGEAWGGPQQGEVLQREFSALEKISIDYGVFEKAERIMTVEADFDWSDVGSWAALTDLLPASEGGVSRGPVVAVDSADNIIWSDRDGHVVGLVGCHDLIVVHTEDATLVCPRDQAEKVKALVGRLREQGRDAWLD